MVRRKPSKAKKYHASRTWGGGNTKNRRGKGGRGGSGLFAGSHKHRWSWVLKYHPEHFGVHGFVNRNASPKLDALNISNLNSRALGGKLKKEGNMFVVSFEGKILGAGSLTVPLLVRAKSFSATAKEKIEKAGGKVEVTK